MLLLCRCGIGFCLDLAGRSFPCVQAVDVLERGTDDIRMTFRTFVGVDEFLENKNTRPACHSSGKFLENRRNSCGVEKTEESIQERIYIPHHHPLHHQTTPPHAKITAITWTANTIF